MKGCVLALLLLFVAASSQADPRQWDVGGVPIRQGHHILWQGATAQDSAGNTAMVWSDARFGDYDVFAQLISPTGEMLWTSGGVNVTNHAPRNQMSPVVCSVTDGWILAWIDFRADSGYCGNVWAQKLDQNGNPVWTGNNSTGIPVDVNASSVFDQTLCIVPDDSGGAFVAWSYHGAQALLYVQRMTSDGQAAWNSSLLITHANGSPAYPEAARDGDGNMLLAWCDRENNTTSVSATKITPDGQIPWGLGGRTVCSITDYRTYPRICSDGAHGCYISWVDNRSNSENIYLQRLDSSGQILWQTNGVTVCNAVNNQSNDFIALSMNGDSADGCLLVWEDSRASGYWSEIYAQKITPAGTSCWTPNGIAICTDAAQPDSGRSHYNPQLVSDREGGMVCVWETSGTSDNWENYSISAQKIISEGTAMWGGSCGRLVSDATGRQDGCTIALTSGGILVTHDDWSTGSQCLRIQLLSMSDGSPQLPDMASAVASGPDNSVYNPKSLTLSPGRIAVVWEDYRATYNNSSLYYQIVAETGQMQRAVNGERLVTDNQGYPYWGQTNAALCPDGSGGFFVAYSDGRTGIYQIRLSHVNAAGSVVDNLAGAVIYFDASTMSDQISPLCAPDGAGGCYVAWSGYNLTYFLDAYIMHMGSHCEHLWQTAVRLSNDENDDVISGLTAAPSGCATAVWRSGPWGSYNINAAVIRANGTVAFTDTICDAPGDQTDPVAVSDGGTGTYIAWLDERDTAHSHGKDIYAQYLTTSEQWDHNGIPVVSDSSYEERPSVALSSNGDLLVSWDASLFSDGYRDIYAQKISSSGERLWPVAHGLPVCREFCDQVYPIILPDRQGGMFATWQDSRASDQQIFATHLDSTGNPIGDSYWLADSGGAVTAPPCVLYYGYTAISDGDGGFIAVWTDGRSENGDEEGGYTNLYAQRIADATSATNHIAATPRTYALSQNYPNPFNPSTVISFALPKAGLTTLKVYDLLGREVTTLVNRSLAAGDHHVTFNGSSLASGIYFYRIESGTFTATKKMVLLK